MPKPSDSAVEPGDTSEAIGRDYFELFNEVGIIAQLSRALFEGFTAKGARLFLSSRMTGPLPNRRCNSPGPAR